MKNEQFLLNKRLKQTVFTELEVPWNYAETGRIFFVEADGAFLKDIHGKQYIDFKNGLGSIILGHNDTDVTKELISILSNQRQVVNGPSIYHIEVAERIIRDVNQHDAVSFFPSGTDAVAAGTYALLNYTRKHIILSSGYHGWTPLWEMSTCLLEPNSFGVIDFFFCLDYLDILIKKHRNNVAGVVISPDFLYLDRHWYDEFFTLCKKARLPIFLDEVKQGYRYGPGSSLENYLDHFPYQADIYAFSKCLTNGFPLACVVSDKEILSYTGDMASTGFYNLFPFAAARIVLEKMEKYGVQNEIRKKGDKFLVQLNKKICDVRLPVEIAGNGNLFQLVFGDEEMEKRFYNIALKQGIVFYDGDNQSLTFAFSEKILNEAFLKLSHVFEELLDEFPHLVGASIPKKAKWEAALRSMEGLPDDKAPSEEKDKFLREYIISETKC